MRSTDIAPVLEFLRCPTPDAWIEAALTRQELLLIDHANCEKKAASTALNLMAFAGAFADAQPPAQAGGNPWAPWLEAWQQALPAAFSDYLGAISPAAPPRPVAVAGRGGRGPAEVAVGCPTEVAWSVMVRLP